MRRSFPAGASVRGGLSPSRAAEASISAALMGAKGGTSSGSSPPQGLTPTSVPLRRILAIVEVLLIFRRPSGRDDSDLLRPLRINNRQHLAAAHGQEDYSLLGVSSTQVDPLHRERVAKGERSLRKAHPVFANVLGRLEIVPRELQIPRYYGIPVVVSMVFDRIAWRRSRGAGAVGVIDFVDT